MLCIASKVSYYLDLRLVGLSGGVNEDDPNPLAAREFNFRGSFFNGRGDIPCRASISDPPREGTQHKINED